MAIKDKGISRRTFLKLSGAAGLTCTGVSLLAPLKGNAYGAVSKPNY